MMLRSIGTGLGIIGIALVSNIVTPLMSLGIPRIKNILGLKIKDVKIEHFDAETVDDFTDDDLFSGSRTPIARDLIYLHPEMLDIKFSNECISINLETNSIIGSLPNDLRPYSFGFDSGGSGNLGLILLGIPGLLLATPLIALFNTAWWGVYRLTDMDVNYYLFFRRIKDQLDADTRFTLRQALVQTSKQNREFRE